MNLYEVTCRYEGTPEVTLASHALQGGGAPPHPPTTRRALEPGLYLTSQAARSQGYGKVRTFLPDGPKVRNTASLR